MSYRNKEEQQRVHDRDGEDRLDEKARADSAAHVRSKPTWSDRLRAALPMGSGFESTRYLTKWILLSTAIGIVAGVGAIIFYSAIDCRPFFLGDIVNYLPPSPIGEGAPPSCPLAARGCSRW